MQLNLLENPSRLARVYEMFASRQILLNEISKFNNNQQQDKKEVTYMQIY